MFKLIKNLGIIVLPVAVVVIGVLVTTNRASAAACTNASNYGLATMTVNVPVAGDYKIWSRIKVPSTASSTYQLEVDSNTCWQVGGSNVPVNSWTWVDWYGGNSVQKVNFTFSTTGNHTLKLIGAATNVQVDKVILLGTGELCSDGTTTPSGDGTNCASAPALPAISSFAASPATITVSNSTTFNWTTTNTTTCSVTPGGPTDVATKTWATQPFISTGTKTYTLTCKNGAGTTTTSTASVTVNPAPTPPTNVTLTTSASSVTSGTPVTLTWTSVGGTSCTLNPGNHTATGDHSSITLSLTSTTAFTASCTNNAGSTSSPSVTVSVVATPPPPVDPVINSFTATPASIDYGSTTKLVWSTSNVVSSGCTLVSSLDSTPIQQAASSELTTAGLTSSVSYTLTCKNSANVTKSKSVSVVVADKPAPPAPDPTPVDQIPSPPPTNTNDCSTSVTTSSGQKVVDAQSSTCVNQGDLVSLDTSTITDSKKVDSIQKVEYYEGEQLLQTVMQAPFALDTKSLPSGSHSITQRTYYKDGSTSSQSQLIEVKGTSTVNGALASKNSGGQSILVGIGSVLALIVVVAATGWYFVLRPRGLTIAESVVYVARSAGSVFNRSKAIPPSAPTGTTLGNEPMDSRPSEYSEPVVISPENKELPK